jgi:hypothetical protein
MGGEHGRDRLDARCLYDLEQHGQSSRWAGQWGRPGGLDLLDWIDYKITQRGATRSQYFGGLDRPTQKLFGLLARLLVGPDTLDDISRPEFAGATCQKSADLDAASSDGGNI